MFKRLHADVCTISSARDQRLAIANALHEQAFTRGALVALRTPMQKYPHRHLLFALIIISSSGCIDSGDELDDTADTATDESAAIAPRRHTFFLDAKSFIRNIPATQLGTLGSPARDFALEQLRGVTNSLFSELPANGDPGASTFRVYGHLQLGVTCTGSVINLTTQGAFSDVGFEGPLRGELLPFKSRTTTGGSFAFQAAGAPNILAEPPFQGILPRTNRHIWYRIDGHVTCDSAGAARLFIDKVTNTNFPSVRVWATHSEGTRFDREALLVERLQGTFSELWRLARVPAF
jgi:hypothetical protein